VSLDQSRASASVHQASVSHRVLAQVRPVSAWHLALALVHRALVSARPVSALQAWAQERLVWASHLGSAQVHPVSVLRAWARERLAWVSTQAIAAAR
jgi:hypothetical protein